MPRFSYGGGMAWWFLWLMACSGSQGEMPVAEPVPMAPSCKTRAELVTLEEEPPPAGLYVQPDAGLISRTDPMGSRAATAVLKALVEEPDSGPPAEEVARALGVLWNGSSRDRIWVLDQLKTLPEEAKVVHLERLIPLEVARVLAGASTGEPWPTTAAVAEDAEVEDQAMAAEAKAMRRALGAPLPETNRPGLPTWNALLDRSLRHGEISALSRAARGKWHASPDSAAVAHQPGLSDQLLALLALQTEDGNLLARSAAARGHDEAWGRVALDWLDVGWHRAAAGGSWGGSDVGQLGPRSLQAHPGPESASWLLRLARETDDSTARALFPEDFLSETYLPDPLAIAIVSRNAVGMRDGMDSSARQAAASWLAGQDHPAVHLYLFETADYFPGPSGDRATQLLKDRGWCVEPPPPPPEE